MKSVYVYRIYHKLMFMKENAQVKLNCIKNKIPYQNSKRQESA